MVAHIVQAENETYTPLKLRGFLIENWCIKRSRLIYGFVSKWMHGEVKINIAMRCRENTCADWGHAWVTHNGIPIMEFNRRLINRPKVKIAESEKYIYWLYE